MISISSNFLCPECGSNSIKGIYKIKRDDKNIDPITKYEIQCNLCFFDIPDYLCVGDLNLPIDYQKKKWFDDYKPKHLKTAAKCSNCNLYYWEIEKKLKLNSIITNNIFLQKFTENDNPVLICRLCEPDNFK